MDLQTRKITFVQEFLRLKDEEIICDLEDFLKKRKSELFERNLTPMSLEHFEQEIKQSLNDADQGKMIKASELKQKIQKWN